MSTTGKLEGGRLRHASRAYRRHYAIIETGIHHKLQSHLRSTSGHTILG